MEKIKIGILGTAAIAKRSVIPGIKALSGRFELAGIASRDMHRALPLANENNCKSFSSYEEIIESNEVNALYIPLPNSLHYKWVRLALERGIHILVEKSLACSLKEVAKLNDIAKSNNLALVENFQFRKHPQLTTLQQIVASGIIGEMRYMRSSFEFPPFPDKTNIRYQKNLGGGALLDAGAYPVKISQIFLGNNLKVKAASLRFDSGYEVDLGGGAYIQQENGGVFSQISFGFDNFYQNSIEIFGSKGKASTNRVFTAPPDFKVEIRLEVQGQPAESIFVEPANHFINMLEHFYSVCNNQALQEEEYQQNISQSKLLQEIKTTHEQ